MGGGGPINGEDLGGPFMGGVPFWGGLRVHGGIWDWNWGGVPNCFYLGGGLTHVRLKACRTLVSLERGAAGRPQK